MNTEKSAARRIEITAEEMASIIEKVDGTTQYGFGPSGCWLLVCDNNKPAMEHLLELRDNKELDEWMNEDDWQFNYHKDLAREER